MKVDGKNYQTIWLNGSDEQCVLAIDQRLLPHRFEIVELRTVDDIYRAIADMVVRGAPLIGVAAAFGLYLAALHIPESVDFDDDLGKAGAFLAESRPTAVNLAWGIAEQLRVSRLCDTRGAKIEKLKENAIAIARNEADICYSIGQFGVEQIRAIAQRKGNRRVNILTHCNAGWLCSVDWGTATAPIYQAFEEKIDIHVWVDETRPRNQGASLTAWELGKQGVPYTLIADNTGGHLMQNGLVDMVIVGTDRTTRCGDVANKIGTYLKALAAHDNNIPFFVAAPSSSIDWKISSGREIPIEQRDADEVRYVSGLTASGEVGRVLIAPADAAVANYGFDVTPARLVTGLITERGIAKADEQSLLSLFPEHASLKI